MVSVALESYFAIIFVIAVFTFLFVDKCVGGPHLDLIDVPEELGYFIASPGYPGKYANNVTCIWTAEASPGFVVRIAIIHFQTEYPYDHLQIGRYSPGGIGTGCSHHCHLPI